MNKLFLGYTFLLLFAFTFQQYDVDLSKLGNNAIFTDLNNCISHEDETTCSTVSMTSGVYQCCRVQTTIQTYNTYYGSYYSGTPTDFCSAWVSFDYTDAQIKEVQRSYQEANTFLSLIYGYHIPKIKMTFICPKKTVTFNYGEGSFTDEEKAIMRDENYCLRLYYEGLYLLDYAHTIVGSNSKTITKDMCMNGKTLPSSGNSCAYASFNFKLSGGTTKKISTCVLVSSTAYESKSLDKLLEEDFAKFTKLDGEHVSSFDAEIANKNGNVLKYDSLTKTVTTKNTKNTDNNARRLGESLLILYSLLLILF